MKILLSSSNWSQYANPIIHFGCYLSAVHKVRSKRKKSIACGDAFLGGSSPNQGWEEEGKGKS